MTFSYLLPAICGDIANDLPAQHIKITRFHPFSCLFNMFCKAISLQMQMICQIFNSKVMKIPPTKNLADFR